MSDYDWHNKYVPCDDSLPTQKRCKACIRVRECKSINFWRWLLIEFYIIP